MPFVANDESEDKDKQNQPQGAVTPAGPSSGSVRLAPSSAVNPGGTGAAGTPSAGAGGSFASINQYLKANQGQAEPLAGKLTSNIGQEYQGLEGQNQQALSKIGSQVSAQPNYSKANETIAQEAANPVSFTSNPGNVASFQNLLKASYAGPASAEGTNEYADQQASINKAISQGQQAVQTEAGRENLLTNVEAKPSTGVTALNSAILSKSPTALASVENAYKPFQSLLTGLQSGAAEQNKAIADRQAQAESAKKAASNALTSQISSLNTSVGNELMAAQQKLAAQNAQVKAELAAGTPSDTTLKALGMTADQWNALTSAQKAAATQQDVTSNQGQFGAKSGTSNVDITKFLSQTDPNAVLNTANVATPEDYAKAQAFQSLMGNLNLAAPTMSINPNATAQAGTAPANVSNFDYQSALNTANQAKTDQVAAAQAYVDALQSGADETHAQMKATEAARMSAEKRGELLSGVGIPLALASSLPVVGQPISKAVDSIIQELSSPSQVGKDIAKGVSSAVNTVTDIFCFHPDTLVTMASGLQLPICCIEVGDITAGGKVLATTRAVGRDFYWYGGVLVTGKHAVKEDGRWIRVEDSPLARALPGLTEVVCSLVTKRHRIYVGAIEFADQHETDFYESLDMDESLRELNKNVTLG